MKSLKRNLMSDQVGKRILTALPALLILFFVVTILSYFLLPEGLLLGKNQASNFETSSNMMVAAFQIWGFNLISVFLIVFGSLFAKRKDVDSDYFSYGYLGFFLLVILNAVTLGTWSFSVNRECVPLMQRLLRTFCVWENAGLIEMLGQMLVACACAKNDLVMITGKSATARKLKDVNFRAVEIAIAIGGVLLMLLGAFIESNAMMAA